MFVVAAALLGLIALLATLQYRWLGQVSDAERERMRASLAGRATGFAQDFDREITRAYLTFQLEAVTDAANLAASAGERFDRWQGTSRYPRIVKDVYIASRTGGGLGLRRFNPSTRFIEPAEWPEAFGVVREQLEMPASTVTTTGGSLVVRSAPKMLWESVPAIVVQSPVVLWNAAPAVGTREGRTDLHVPPVVQYVVLALDREYITGELLPTLADQHFRDGADDIDYDVAVVETAAASPVYSTSETFSPDSGEPSDAAADLFQVRFQEFGAMVSEVRRFTSFVASRVEQTARLRATLGDRVELREGPLSFMVHASPGEKRQLETAIAAAPVRETAAPAWRLIVKHPSGSLETAVGDVRRRNLLVSSGILAILGVSVGFLVVSTRRAQDLARQQMEFVAAVSHELRTPLAVIRSAADNLAEGVVREDDQVRRYGALVRGEGRRLSEMVEQILELAGIHSGQRGFSLAPVTVLPLLRDVVDASSTLIGDAGMTVEYDVPEGLPPVLGEEAAVRRVFQNLVSNAIKYGAQGGWIGITAQASGREVRVTVADRGIGIDPAEQSRVFEPFYRTPDVISAQIHGAGLGLSLVQRIVEAHGGRISLRSAPGQGSEFTVHLPAASGEDVPRTTSIPDPARTSA
jgi:signal transduction histidine kinase